MNPSHIILSGGSVAPEKAGNAMRIVKAFSGRIPIMGICLGYRHLRSLWREVHPDGGNRAGKTGFDQVVRRTDLFHGVPDTFYAGFYHSETVLEKDIPQEFDVIARNGNDVAGIAHKTEPTFGLQFHPESFLSEYGKEIMQNFLRAAGTAHDGAQMASTGHALYII